MDVLKTRPFETYHYYKDLSKKPCANCETKATQYFLRYRTYLGTTYPIIRTNNIFYTVCPTCYNYDEIEDELFLMKLLRSAKHAKIYKYNKFSILSLEDNNRSVDITYSITEMFEYNLLHHIKDMSN